LIVRFFRANVMAEYGHDPVPSRQEKLYLTTNKLLSRKLKLKIYVVNKFGVMNRVTFVSRVIFNVLYCGKNDNYRKDFN